MGAQSSHEVPENHTADWNSLPPHLLERIFSFLDLTDRVRCSQVCKFWNEIYHSPIFWRAPVFRFKFDKTNRLKPAPPRPFIKSCGKFFKKLTIYYKGHTCKTKFIRAQVIEFLDILNKEGVQLESIQVPKLLKMFVGMHRISDEFERLLEFLRSQRELKDVDFSNSKTLDNHGLLALENLNPDNVQHLKIHKFFHTSVPDVESERFMEVLCKFSNLRTLSLNYNYLSEELMARLCGVLSGKLEKFSVLRQRRSISAERFLTDDCWINFKRHFPLLEVTFTIEVGYNDETTDEVLMVKPILLSSVPLTEIGIIGRYTSQGPGEQSFDFLANRFGRTLKTALFDVHGIPPANGLFNFIRRCSSLQNLTIKAICVWITTTLQVKRVLDTIFDAVYLAYLENNVSMQAVRVVIRRISILDKNYQARSWNGDYSRRFRDIGIQFSLDIMK